MGIGNRRWNNGGVSVWRRGFQGCIKRQKQVDTARTGLSRRRLKLQRPGQRSRAISGTLAASKWQRQREGTETHTLLLTWIRPSPLLRAAGRGQERLGEGWERTGRPPGDWFNTSSYPV